MKGNHPEGSDDGIVLEDQCMGRVFGQDEIGDYQQCDIDDDLADGFGYNDAIGIRCVRGVVLDVGLAGCVGGFVNRRG